MAQIPNRFGENNDPQGQAPRDNGPNLVGFCMKRIEIARNDRDSKYAHRWTEYTRLARGFYGSADKNNDSERSKLIAPALAQAVEMTVAEMEEAVFGRKAWFDITDDIADENRDDVILYRDQLLEDFELDGMADAISKCFLMGSIYGTGILKLNVTRKDEMSIVDGKPVRKPRIAVIGECIRPDEFGIDPSALTVDEAEYVFHEMIKPWWGIREKQRTGIYKGSPVTAFAGTKSDTDGTGAKANVSTDDNGVQIIEYFGRVPAAMIKDSGKTEGTVEAIVTIANESTILRAVVSPFTMKDRPIVAYQHDTVPGEFWGRGVCEKGYNPQKALDAELRARVDTLALITAPMMGADITRLPRNPDMRVRPGKTVFTRGRPSEIYEPITFGNPAILAHTFQQSGDLERMVQMGTGAMDSATPVGVNSRNETASGISQLQAGSIKRSKRTMQNVERQFLDPLVRRALWRYMQFDPSRYQVDMKFVVNATMGIMAKEVENVQLTNMLGFLQPGEPGRDIIVQALLANTSSSEKGAVKAAVEAMNKPPTPEETERAQKLEDIQMRIQEANANKEEALARKEAALAEKAAADTQLALAKAEHEKVDTDLADDIVEISAANAVTGAEKIRAQDRQTAVAATKVAKEGANGPGTGSSAS
jgi:hypothetical protein